jgi:aryl-alcohol dehydrogenase
MGIHESRIIKAAIVRETGGAMSIEDVTIGQPADDEVLVRIVATGSRSIAANAAAGGSRS